MKNFNIKNKDNKIPQGCLVVRIALTFLLFLSVESNKRSVNYEHLNSSFVISYP